MYVTRLLRAFFQTIRPDPHRGLTQGRIEALVDELIATRLNGNRLIIRAPRDERVLEFRLDGFPENGSLVSWFPYARWPGDSLVKLRRVLDRQHHAVADVSNLGRKFLRVDVGLNPSVAAEFALAVLVEAIGCDPVANAVATLHDFRSFEGPAANA
jgi:hypothetical protein